MLVIYRLRITFLGLNERYSSDSRIALLSSSSRSVSGTMRKLVSDGFVEKIGDKSALYIITTKGKELEID